jgi:integrase
MAYSEVPAFLVRLREQVTWSRLALEAAILTATRSGEVRGARWEEIDLEAATWTIPADRMKGGRMHIVPLSGEAIRAFEAARNLCTGELCFPGRDARKPMSDMAMTKLLRDMGMTATVHGFRSAFRDWAAEETKFPGEVAEAALAHVVPDRVERAYKRTDFLAKRRLLMAAWADFLENKTADVISFPSRAAREV